MADVRHEPDWDQGADRHSALIEPVVVVRQLSRFDYRKHYSRIDNALVFTTNKGEYDVHLPPRRPSRSQCAKRRYTAVYEVDMGVHRCNTSAQLPSDDDAFDFTAAYELTWQVVRPEQFVISGERDVPALLTRRLGELIGPVSRTFPIDRSAHAEDAACRAVAAAGPLGDQAGLRVSWAVRLRLDDDAIAQAREVREIRYSGNRLGLSHDLAMREDLLRTERETAQARQQHELSMLRGRQEEELRELEERKIEFYQHYLQYEGPRSWAVHLARHPEDSQLVMTNLRQDQLALLQSQKDVVLQVLNGEALEEYQGAEVNKHTVRFVEEFLTRGPAGSDPAPFVPGAPLHPSAGNGVSFRKPAPGEGAGAGADNQ